MNLENYYKEIEKEFLYYLKENNINIKNSNYIELKKEFNSMFNTYLNDDYFDKGIEFTNFEKDYFLYKIIVLNK